MTHFPHKFSVKIFHAAVKKTSFVHWIRLSLYECVLSNVVPPVCFLVYTMMLQTVCVYVSHTSRWKCESVTWVKFVRRSDASSEQFAFITNMKILRANVMEMNLFTSPPPSLSRPFDGHHRPPPGSWRQVPTGSLICEWIPHGHNWAKLLLQPLRCLVRTHHEETPFGSLMYIVWVPETEAIWVSWHRHPRQNVQWNDPNNKLLSFQEPYYTQIHLNYWLFWVQISNLSTAHEDRLGFQLQQSEGYLWCTGENKYSAGNPNCHCCRPRSSASQLRAWRDSLFTKMVSLSEGGGRWDFLKLKQQSNCPKLCAPFMRDHNLWSKSAGLYTYIFWLERFFGFAQAIRVAFHLQIDTKDVPF